MDYPFSAPSSIIDDYHGTPVTDPYRWLEDTDSSETRLWIEAQNALTFSFLEKLSSRSFLRQRLEQVWNYAKAWAPIKRGGRYFQLRNSGLQNQDVLYVLDDLQAEPRLLLDPNTLSEDGTVSLGNWSVSPDGAYLAYATSRSGSDWLEWKVRDTVTALDLPDLIQWSKFSGAAWLNDGSGFFYSRYDAPAEGQDFLQANYYHELYFHRLGTPQEQDVLVYQRIDQKEWGFEGHVSHDGRYLVILVWVGTDRRNLLFYLDLLESRFLEAPAQATTAASSVVELISELEANYDFIGNNGPVFYLRTDLEAGRGRLIAIDIRQPERQNWQTLIPEGADTLEAIHLVGGELVALALHDAHHRLLRYHLDGTPLGEIPLPMIGSLFNLENWGWHSDPEQDEMFFAFHSFTCPITVYRWTVPTAGAVSQPPQKISSPPIPFDFSPYVTRQVFVVSKDGTHVPMFLTHRQDLSFDQPQPTLLYGYGGFNIAITPGFEINRLVFLEKGGVLAVANLRGGAEYGEEWHAAGTKERKQNVFDDFIACAEWLIRQGISSPDRLAIQGRSNGGLLVGAVMTQRPELFACALPAVGVMDMLRFHKFTIGWAWVSDFGSADTPGEFPYLYAYSPLHNLRPGTSYPATLITTADHDDRVVPGHSFKFAATLQAAQSGEKPCLIRIQTKAGHGMGKPTAMLIEENADIWAFAMWALGME